MYPCICVCICIYTYTYLYMYRLIYRQILMCAYTVYIMASLKVHAQTDLGPLQSRMRSNPVPVRLSGSAAQNDDGVNGGSFQTGQCRDNWTVLIQLFMLNSVPLATGHTGSECRVIDKKNHPARRLLAEVCRACALCRLNSGRRETHFCGFISFQFGFTTQLTHVLLFRTIYTTCVQIMIYISFQQYADYTLARFSKLTPKLSVYFRIDLQVIFFISPFLHLFGQKVFPPIKDLINIHIYIIYMC